MKDGEIGRVGRAQFTERRMPPPGPPPDSTIVRHHRPERQDVVELTEPHRAALRLLRERILENTRLALKLTKRDSDQFHFVRIPAENAKVFLGRLISDQNAMASFRRGKWSPERVDAALEAGLVQGTAEATEVLYELDELDVFTWRMISSVVDEYYSRIAGVLPDEIRQRVWEDL